MNLADRVDALARLEGLADEPTHLAGLIDGLLDDLPGRLGEHPERWRGAFVMLMWLSGGLLAVDEGEPADLLQKLLAAIMARFCNLEPVRAIVADIDAERGPR